MISVCIATHNGEKYIKKQIESILSQLSGNDEVIVSDDESTDSTLDIIRDMDDPRIKLFSHKPAHINNKFSKAHYLVTSNFENALQKSSGDYIFLSDQDDIWLPGKVDSCVAFLASYTMVITNMQIIDENGEIVQKRYYLKKPLKGFIKNLMYSPFYGCCMAFRRELITIALPFPKNLIMHDAWLGNLASLHGNIYYIENPYIQYRRHSSNVSPPKSKNPVYFKILYRISLFIKILRRLIII